MLFKTLQCQNDLCNIEVMTPGSFRAPPNDIIRWIAVGRGPSGTRLREHGGMSRASAGPPVLTARGALSSGGSGSRVRRRNWSMTRVKQPTFGTSQFAGLKTLRIGLLSLQMICCCHWAALLCASAAAQNATGSSSTAVTAAAGCGANQLNAETLSGFDALARARW